MRQWVLTFTGMVMMLTLFLGLDAREVYAKKPGWFHPNEFGVYFTRVCRDAVELQVVGDGSVNEETRASFTLKQYTGVLDSHYISEEEYNSLPILALGKAVLTDHGSDNFWTDLDGDGQRDEDEEKVGYHVYSERRIIAWPRLLDVQTPIIIGVGELTSERPLEDKIEATSGELPTVEACYLLNTAFTYQGVLADEQGPVTSVYDFRFTLYDNAADAYGIVGEPVEKTNVAVTNGLFSTELDFGPAFNASPHWLAIELRPVGAGDYQPLAPRQPLYPVPQALSVRWDGISNVPAGFSDHIDNDTLASLLCTNEQIAKWDGYEWSCADNNAHTHLGQSWQGTSGIGLQITMTGLPLLLNSSASNGLQVANANTFAALYSENTSVTGDAEGLVAVTRSAGGEAIEAINASTSITANIIIGCSSNSSTNPVCSDVEFSVRRDGNVRADGAFTGGGADYADLLRVSGDPASYSPGDVLVIGADGLLTKATQPDATTIVGDYSTQPAFIGDRYASNEVKTASGMSVESRPASSQQTQNESGQAEEIVASAAVAQGNNLVPVALVGVVPTKVSAENGAIQPGDLLTTSSIPGHAMKASPLVMNGISFYAPGTIIGKALQPLASGTGMIDVLVTLQ
jgi:hypothetical protein